VESIIDIQPLAIHPGIAQGAQNHVVAATGIDGTIGRSDFLQKGRLVVIRTIDREGESPIGATNRLIQDYVINPGVQ